MVGECLCAAECTVAADCYDSVKTQELAGRHSFALTFLGHEFLAAGGVQYRAAAVDDMGNIFFIKANDITGDQTVVATPDAVTFDTVVQGSADYRTNTRVHSRSVTAAGKHTDSFNLHTYVLLGKITICILL